jgi:hypothetical protein
MDLSDSFPSSMPTISQQPPQTTHLNPEDGDSMFHQNADIVTWWLEAGIVEQDKAATARQQHGKHISKALN